MVPVMSRLPEAHLNDSELDQLLDVPPREGPILAHFEHCQRCRALVEADRRLVALLRRVPEIAPSPGFADRVMARVVLPSVSPERSILRLPVWLRRPPPVRLVAALGVTLLVLAASLLWSWSNREVLILWRGQALSLVDGWLWLSWRKVAAAVTAQPFYGAARELLGSPARIGAAVTAVVATYAAGVLALRRLLALPAGPVAHADR